MIRLLAFLLILVAATPATAQFDRLNTPQGSSRENAIRPELVVNPPAAPGGAAELAILMHVKPGWHGYWLNPGDAGLPMSVEWRLPAGWSVGPLRYPVPHRLLASGIVNYVYESDYSVLTKISAPSGSNGPKRIAASMRWLACTEKVCVPEQGDVSLEIPDWASIAPNLRFNQWRQALPRPLSSAARFAVDGDRLRIGIPLPQTVGLTDPYFFPATENAVAYDAPQTFRRDGDVLVAEVKLGPERPSAIEGVLAFGDGDGLEIKAVPGLVPTGGSLLGGAARTSLIAAFLGALLGGLFLNLMPCVFPILAMKAMHLARAGGDEAESRREALSYAAGATLGTAALGGILMLVRAGGSAAGWAFQLQDPRTTLLLLVLAVAITLNLLRLFQFPVLAGERAPAGSFATGALAAFVATPCAGPFMGAALGAALLLPLWASVLVFAMLGLGLALPVAMVAFVPALRLRLPRPGPWMQRLQRFLAVPMVATAVACLWLLYRQAGTEALAIGAGVAGFVALLLAGIGALQRGGRKVWPAAIAGIGLALAGGIALLPAAGTGSAHVPVGVGKWSAAAVQGARAANKPVFVYFTADWCLTCKANEAAAINRSPTVQAFRDSCVVVLAGDWTNGDPEIGRFLESQGRAGVPLYLWYAPAKSEPEILPQVLTPGMLISRALATGCQ